MRRNIPTIFAILLLGLLILCSACTGPETKKPEVNVGLSQVPTQEISPSITFDEAIQAFGEYSRTSGSAEKFPVYYLFSRDVDAAGNASSWLFGVRQENGTALLMYDRTGWKINPWNATLPEEEIVLSQVIPPGTLFARNKEVLSGASSPSIPESRDLVLKEGTYTLTIRSGNTSRTLMFNATTGKEC